MELDAVDREVAMAHGHHLSVGGGGGNLELVRDARDRERVVAARGQIVAQAGEEAAPVVLDRRRLAVYELPCGADLASEGLRQRLMAKADAQGRDARRESAQDLDRRAGGGRTAGTGGDDEVRRVQELRSVRVDRVVSPDDDVRTELAEEVREVVGEAVVVVDQEDHATSSARSIACSSAASLARHSACSAAGSESATIPAPACRCAIPFASTIVRMA